MILIRKQDLLLCPAYIDATKNPKPTITEWPIYTLAKFVLFSDTFRAHWFSYHWLLDVKRMVIVTYFFRGNTPSHHIGYSF